MRTIKSLTLFALLLSLSFAVFADTSIDAKDEVKPNEEVEVETNDVVVEPQQGFGFCRFGCCGGWTLLGQCRYCCRQPKAVEEEAVDANVVEPQQRGGGCRYGCCGGWFRGRCRYCCRQPQTVETEAVDANVVEPQQGGWYRGGCRYGCCGGWYRGRCSSCCATQAEANEFAEKVEPQQRRGCRYGCCGSFAYGQCSACCTKKMATEEQKKEEAKP